jgi:peptidoglycan/xylan/chitin deacetylase (PgdA/CDA1 family)
MPSHARLSPTYFSLITGVAALVATTFIAGCNKPEEPKAVAPPKPVGPPQISADVLEKERPNEAGAVMVIMYHRIAANEPDSDLNRRPETFRKDLQTLYDKGYRPVTAAEYVENKIDIPAGKTPVVLTFDDALPTQFHIKNDANGKQVIDKDCAVGIMQKFSEANPDWKTKATFFVLPKEGKNSDTFGQAESVQEKLSFLLDKGYEIANHSATHANMRGMNADEVKKELATAVRGMKALAGADADKAPFMQTLALPYGKLPRNDAARDALIKGESGGTAYEHKGVFLAAWRPTLSAITKKEADVAQGSMCVFDPARLERVTPNAKGNSEPGTLEYWIKYFDKNPQLRYISDGDPTIAAVPASHEKAVDASKVKSLGQTLQIYGGAKSGDKKSGGNLEVG